MLSQHEHTRKVLTLDQVLAGAEAGGYGIGAFSPRYLSMIRPVLRAAQHRHSVVIIQISQKELTWYQVELNAFAREFYTALQEEAITVPVVLHLDHTRDLALIKEAISHEFTSVMIDASNHPFSENVAITKKVVEYAHAKGIAVEGELGRIGTTDFLETDDDQEWLADPLETKAFAEETKVDALAVAVGTAHGAYNKQHQPKIDYRRLQEIKKLTSVPLVLHGGSGVPAAMVKKAIKLPNGGISKVNFATDLEQAFLKAIGREQRMLSKECAELSADLLTKGQAAVEREVIVKIREFLGSEGSARDF